MSKWQTFAQNFGLHPIAGFGMFTVDAMLFGKEAATLFVSLPISFMVAAILAVGVAFVQKGAYQDNLETAIGKAVIVGVITAIPTAIPGVLTLTAGIVGASHLMTRSTVTKQ